MGVLRDVVDQKGDKGLDEHEARLRDRLEVAVARAHEAAALEGGEWVHARRQALADQMLVHKPA